MLSLANLPHRNLAFRRIRLWNMIRFLTGLAGCARDVGRRSQQRSAKSRIVPYPETDVVPSALGAGAENQVAVREASTPVLAVSKWHFTDMMTPDRRAERKHGPRKSKPISGCTWTWRKPYG